MKCGINSFLDTLRSTSQYTHSKYKAKVKMTDKRYLFHNMTKTTYVCRSCL